MFSNTKFAVFASCLTLVMLAGTPLRAQEVPPQTAGLSTLKQAFDAAWARQPEGRSLDLQQEAAAAQRQQAASWLVAPPALEASGKTDQVAKNEGNREYALGVALPLWLPGERQRSGALAEANAKAVASRVLSARLRAAATVREAWWNWQRLMGERTLAVSRLDNFRQLAGDVERRVKAGDLALADQHQAAGAVAAAEAALAEADSNLAAASGQLRALTGATPLPAAADHPESVPALSAALSSDLADVALPDAAHPDISALSDQAEVARRAADLASVQRRENPELTLAVSRERGAFNEDWQQALTLGVRIPLGAESRNRAKVAQARAEAIETESRLQLERERLAADLEASRVRVESMRVQLVAAEKRARLAHESREFFDKSFRLGESDLPTRLRIELEAAEAENLAFRARIDLAAAISALRQALGLLPE
ncbi:MAG: TolC family protein [Zoogloeaceae bacterium]|jgi:cobalt-zinc-cadmium efflux system outer membrane protein|nr:TolC family protein [Zoogloeaceae bacterium]